MSVEDVLSRLEKVRKTGPETWLACCPVHGDKHPSLSIRDCADGRVLMRCHAQQCSVGDMLGAVGLDFDAIFPPKPLGDRLPPLRRPFPAADVLEAIFQDALVVQQVANEVQRSGEVTPHQRSLLQNAIARVSAAQGFVNG